MAAKRIGILGEGVTAVSIRKYARANGIDVVDPVDAELIIASPGINPAVFPIVECPIISEIEWAFQLFQEGGNPPKLIAVTGTNGKSTATAMISHVCDCPYAGNIGIPLIDYVGLEQEFPVIVVEVSSYQLETCETFRPDIAVFLNITPDHLTRHGSFNAYIAQKTKCCSEQLPSDFVVYHAADRYVEACVQESLAEPVPFVYGDHVSYFGDDFPFIGAHMVLNALAAVKVAECLGMSVPSVVAHLGQFKPLKHRLELLLESNGIRVYNDSKATNPDSTIKALESFESRVWLICCGEDKGLMQDVLCARIAERSCGLLAFGDIGPTLIEGVRAIQPEFTCYAVSTVEEAVQKAFSVARNGDVILFSPSSSSMDQFKNFEERGNRFSEVVTAYVETLLV